MVTCPNCGGLNPDEARFCGHCGQVLAVVATEPPTLGERAPAPAGLGRSPSFEAATAARGEKAGTWQRVVLGLAALALLLGAVSSKWGFPASGTPPLVLGLAYGYAAARPPRSRFLRQFLVSVAVLGLLMAAAAGVFIIWILFYYQWY